jgi:hypothetical protein
MIAMKHIAMTTTPAAPALATTGMRGKVDGSTEGEGAEVVGGGRAAEERERERENNIILVTLLKKNSNILNIIGCCAEFTIGVSVPST